MRPEGRCAELEPAPERADAVGEVDERRVVGAAVVVDLDGEDAILDPDAELGDGRAATHRGIDRLARDDVRRALDRRRVALRG